MEKILLVFVFLMVGFVGNGQKLHLIYAIEEDTRIGSEKDKLKLQKLIKDIEGELPNLEIIEYYTNSNFTKKWLEDIIIPLDNKSNNDIIWFYYSGHGINYDTWPEIYENEISQTEIHNRLKKTNARLTLTVFDCCNYDVNIVSKPNYPNMNSIKISTLNNKYNNYESLFLKTKGNIVACSASATEFSYFNPTTGGNFSTILFKNIKKENSWSRVLNLSQVETNRISALKNRKQTPKFAWENAGYVEEKLQNLNLVWHTPDIDFNNNKTYKEKKLPIRVKAFGNANLSTSDFAVYINGQIQQNGKVGEVSLQGTTFTTTVTMVEGKNEIVVAVGNQQSKVLTAHYSARKPNLYLLAFAPNYKNSNSTQSLKYTEADAKGFVQAFEQQQAKGVYNYVESKLLLGAAATATNLKIELESLTNKAIHKEDIVMVFVSSHGSQMAEDGVFRILGDDYRGDAPSSTSLNGAFLGTQLAKLDCKKMLFIDACYSGGFIGKDDDEVRAINETLKALTEAQQFMVTFTSSRGNQKSYEHPNWQHGAFTKVLLEGLNGKADQNNDRKITINEISSYLEMEVPKIVDKQYHKKQQPNMYLKDVDGRLPIFVY
jgi:hypothetical protein